LGQENLPKGCEARMKKEEENTPFNMLEEGTNSYETKNIDSKNFEIKINVPMKFKNIWLVKLNDLKTTLNEVDYWNSDN